MPSAVRKTISLPRDLARATVRNAREDGKSLSAYVQDALRIADAARARRELREIQSHWSTIVRDKGILTEADLERYLER